MIWLVKYNGIVITPIIPYLSYIATNLKTNELNKKFKWLVTLQLSYVGEPLKSHV